MSFTESVYLDAVSPDGKQAFVTRLARHVDDSVAWLWLHVFLDDFLFAFARDDFILTGGPTPDTSDGARYSLDADGGQAQFDRAGPRPDPAAATVSVHLPEHDVSLAARFEPRGRAGSNLPGRTEVLGHVEATISTRAGKHEIAGFGQFHEQHQTAPRFQVPFTYGTLRGADFGVVFVIGPKASTGFVRDGDSTSLAREVRIDPVGERRSLHLDLDSGDDVDVDVTRRHHYLLPINGHPRDSSIVVATTGGRRLSGCVNDWKPEVTV